MGFVPADYDISLTDMRSRPGTLSSPDDFLFFPKESSRQTKKTIVLPNKEAFLQVKKRIEKLKALEIQGDTTGIIPLEIAYHPLYQNCATFAKDIADFAIKDLGGKAVKSATLHPLQEALKKFLIGLEKLLIYVILHLPIVKKRFNLHLQPIDATIPKIAKKTLFLPIDLT